MMDLDERMKRTETTRLPYWYSKLLEAGVHLNIAMPRTEMIPVSREVLSPLVDGEVTEEINKILEYCKVAGRRIGYPLFLRTDLVSGKHNWKNSCYVPSEKVLLKHIQGVIEENEMVDILGAPYEALCFREYIKLYSHFTAFNGDLPIARERRYFVKDGEVICHHPYWPSAAFWNVKSDGVVKHQLAELNHESPEEIQLLTKYTEQIGRVLKGYWSVDFAWSEEEGERWYMIDMADGYLSFHWEGCPDQLELPEEIQKGETPPPQPQREPAPWSE